MEENVNYDYCEIETKNVELENSVAKLLSENERLCNEINHVKQVFKEQFDSIKKTRVSTKEHSDSLIDKLNLKSAENEDLKAQIQDKVFVITSLKNNLGKIKGKEIVDIAAQIPSANTIVLGMFKLDLEPLAPSSKKVAVTPKNKVKKVRFAEPITSSSNIKQVESSNTSDSNTHVLSSTGLKCSTSKCGSKPTCNKKNDRISRTTSRNMKNKVEAQPRKVNKKNRVVEPICDVDVKHSLLNANSEPICANCKKSMFDGVHDKCLLDFVENMNSRAKSAKKHKKENIWKPAGHVFTEVGFKCKPTSRTFTIVGNACPLTRITSTNVVQIVLRFGNDNIARIIGYGDYQLGNDTISRVYYLAKDGLARGIPRLKFQKDHLCSACALGKSRKYSHQPKVIVDDYSRFTWVRFLKTKDEAPAAIIKCIKNIQVRLKAIVQNVRTDNGTEFVNQTIREWYENVGITHQTSVARTSQQNGVVERRNQTLVEASQTMLIFSKAPLFLWAEAINTACYTQNRPGLQGLTPATSSTGLDSNPVSQQPCLPPIRDY
ncbi:retrovirus-related pol polyprotein from transposon TNT 1-94 [Tanacetum coccineum]